jgi:hypothetical protein
MTDVGSGRLPADRRISTLNGRAFGQSGTPKKIARQLFTNAPMLLSVVRFVILKRGPTICPSPTVAPPLPKTLKTVEVVAGPSVSTSRIGSA